jgi:hypothetical protein
LKQKFQKTRTRGAHPGAPQEPKQIPEVAYNNDRPTPKPALPPTLLRKETKTTIPERRTNDPETGTRLPTSVHPSNKDDPKKDGTKLWLCCYPYSFASFECPVLPWTDARLVLLLSTTLYVISQFD